MGALIRGAFAGPLKRERERYNALYAHARRAAPSLDAGRFSDFLREVVAPIIDRMEEARPDAVQAVSDALYEIGLEMAAHDLPGRYPAVVEGWRALFSRLPHLLAEDPHEFAAAITNALYNLSAAPGADAGLWIETLLRLGAKGIGGQALLDAGKVTAWRCGMAHYRSSALAACAHLDAATARIALGIPDSEAHMDVAGLIRALQADPWLDPKTAGNRDRKLQVAHRVGGFRGFGGAFLRPPRAACQDGVFYLSDGEAVWTLHADRFGATLHRAGLETLPGTGALPAHAFLDGLGRLTFNGASDTIPELRDATTVAASSVTLVATLPLSHDARVVGLL